MRGIRAFIRFLWGLAVTVTVLGGTAVLLAHTVGSPLPDDVPTRAEIEAFVDNPLTPAVGKAATAGALWLAWLAIVVVVALQAWVMRSRHAGKLRLPRPLQLATAGLFGVGVLNFAVGAQAHDLSAGLPPRLTEEQAVPQPQRAAGPGATPPIETPSAGPHVNERGGNPPARAESSRSHDGLQLPGGWIAGPVASGILATTAAALLNGSHPGQASAILRAIRASQHPQADPAVEGSSEPVAADDLAMLEDDASVQTELLIGVREGDYLTADALPRSVVGLTGPGAADALRGMLVAAAAASQAAIVASGALLDRMGTGGIRLPNLSVAADPQNALHLVQLEIGTRYAAHTTAGSATKHPPMILITDLADDDERLGALAILGHDLNIHIVTHGPCPTGTTWHIDERGHATNGQTPLGRLNTLNQAALHELAQTLQPAPASRPTISPPSRAPAPASASRPLRLRILGRPTLTTPAQPATVIRRSGALQIAVYLALHPDGASRADLTEQIFGHMTAENAATSLNTCLHELRRVLTLDGQSALQNVGGGYRLDDALISVDWWQLQALLQRGELQAAVALYTGPVADGHQWDWLPEHRQTARRLIADTYTLLADTANSPQQALDYALAGIDANPYAQNCYAAAIQAHLRSGNTNGAEILHRTLEQRLARTGGRLDPAITQLLTASRRQSNTTSTR